jgi:hypothetical protein
MSIMARASSSLPDEENLVSCNTSLAVTDELAMRESPAGKEVNTEAEDTVGAVARQRLVKKK